MARFATANTIINRAAVECGLLKDTDPVGSLDESFVQMTELLTACGQELVELHPWEILKSPFSLTTAVGDTGDYDLPDDFSYMIDQTGWDRNNDVPVFGPLSSQDWAYLEGRNLVSQSIYASFRLAANQFSLFPQPPPADLEVNFEYLSRNWVETPTSLRADLIENGSDIVLYEPILIVKFLVLKFKSAKGFPIEAAVMEFENMFNSRTGKDTGAPIISASNSRWIFPYIQPYRNTGDTGYGG